MEDIFEFAAELAVEAFAKITKNKSIPKWIRYPLLMLYVAVFLAIVAGIFILGTVLWPVSRAAAVLLISVSLLLAAAAVYIAAKKVRGS